MTGTPAVLADLLADCDAHGIRLALAGDGGLTIDAPQDALTPDLLARLKARKADLLAMLRPGTNATPIDRTNASAVWLAALGLLEGDPLFSAVVLKELRSANVRWIDDPSPVPTTPMSETPAKPAKPVCRCGSTAWRDVPVHDGQSVRRDCGRCGRFLYFSVWHGKSALRYEQ